MLFNNIMKKNISYIKKPLQEYHVVKMITGVVFMFDFILRNFHLPFLIIAVFFMPFIVGFKRPKTKRQKEVERKRNVEYINELLEPYGYAYDPNQDILYSIVDAWQRKMGYSRLYDELAAPSFMIIDCEPVYFEYNNKRWMVEFWKGQYGIMTGFEIGVYYTDGPDLTDQHFNWTFYNCADDDNMLKMKSTLTKNGKSIMKRKGLHWWLTGFKPGEFSEPQELTANIAIALKNIEMRNAFLRGLRKAGYTKKEITIKGNTVSFTFDKPKTPQPYTRTPELERIIQKKNRELCHRFNEITKSYDNVPDKIIVLKEIDPDMLKRVLSIGKAKGIFN